MNYNKLTKKLLLFAMLFCVTPYLYAQSGPLSKEALSKKKAALIEKYPDKKAAAKALNTYVERLKKEKETKAKAMKEAKAKKTAAVVNAKTYDTPRERKKAALLKKYQDKNKAVEELNKWIEENESNTHKNKINEKN